jgi:peptide/nickel transport system substrate-binding protein
LSKRLSKMALLVVVGLLCLALVAFPACSQTGEQQEEEEEEGIPYRNDGIFVQETIGEIDTLDPAWCYDTASGEQIYYIYEGLLGYDGAATDKFVGLCADSWEIAPDSSSITFHIREGVKFSNGDLMTPEDVEYSLERHMVTDPYSNYGPMWMVLYALLDVYTTDPSEGITGEDIDNAVEIVNGDSVRLNLVRPYPMGVLQQILCGSWCAIVDKQFCIDNGDWPGTWDNWRDWNDPEKEELILHDIAMGTGPWALDVWEQPGQIKLVKNQYYWKGADTVPFDRVITKFVDEWSSRKLSLLAGDADIVYCPRTNIHDLDGIVGVQAIKDLPELTIDAFYFNFDIAEGCPYIGSGALDGNGIPLDFFTDIDVRKGFNYAFDWDKYIEQAMQGEAAQRASCIVEGLPYYNPNTPMYTYDPDLAEEHLKAAWGGQVWEKGFAFTLIYNAGNIVRKTACEILAENLAKINNKFKVSVLPVVWAGTLATIRSKSWAMFQIGWLPDYADPDNFVYPYMHSTGTFSGPASYNNPTVDALIEEGSLETDPAKRQQIYYDLQDFWYTDAPGIMIAQPLGRRFFTEYIDGFIFNPTICGQPGPLYYMTKSAS